eukprot:275524-Pleurochrysis_carterae.AAC.3
MDSYSTPASVAAMHATPMPRRTRVMRTAHGNGARPHRPTTVLAPALHSSKHCLRVLTARSKRRLGHAASERDRRQRRAQRVARYDYVYAGAVASHRLPAKRPRRRHAKRSRRICAGGGWPMLPTSLDSTASHAAFAQLTLRLHQRRLCTAALFGPCRSPAPRVLDFAPSLAFG